jgi:hypothetical protein
MNELLEAILQAIEIAIGLLLAPGIQRVGSGFDQIVPG